MENQTTITTVTDRGFYIEYLLSGPQTTETLRKANLQLTEMANDFTAKNKVILALALLDNMQAGFNPKALRESLRIFEAINFKRFAISGELPGVIMTMVDGIINSFEHSFEIKYFSDKVQAIAWLKEYKP